jgi:hypothetical protein
MKKAKDIFKAPFCSYTGENFEDWFFDMPFDIKKSAEPLIGTMLPRRMNSSEILEQLNPTEVSLEELYGTLQVLDHSVWALFYIKDVNGVLRSVSAVWIAGIGGWNVNARGVARPIQWGAGDQVFSCNSRDTQSLGSLDILTLENLGSRISELEKRMDKYNLK